MSSDNSTFDINFTVLKLFGFWALDNEGNKLKNRIYVIYRWFGVAGYALCLSLQLIDLYFVMDDNEKMITNLCLTISVANGFSKLLRNLQKLSELKNLRQELTRMEGYDDYKEIFSKATKEMKFMNGACYAAMYSLLFFYILTPLLDDETKSKNLPFRQWFPFDVKVTPNYELAYFYQVFYIFFTGSHFLFWELCFYAYIIKISAEYDILEKNIQDINQIAFSGSDF